MDLHLLCRLIAMFLTSSMSSAPRAAQGEPVAKKSKSQDVSRQIDNLDCRLRQLEGDRVTYFFSAERCPGVVAQLKAVEDHNRSRAPQRGQHHPDHNKKATLMAALLNWTAMQDCAPLYEGAKEEVDRLNKVLAALRKPSLPEQLNALTTILPCHTGPLSQTRSQQTCPISLLPHSLLNNLTTLICFALQATGGVQAPGTPPKGALFHNLDRLAPRAAYGRHTRSMHDFFSPRASSDTGRCVGVRAAVLSSSCPRGRRGSNLGEGCRSR